MTKAVEKVVTKETQVMGVIQVTQVTEVMEVAQVMEAMEVTQVMEAMEVTTEVMTKVMTEEDLEGLLLPRPWRCTTWGSGSRCRRGWRPS